MADKERILSLEGQVADLSDRLAEYEQAEMLRRVSEDEVIKAEGLTGKRKKDIRMELEKPIWTAFVSWAMNNLNPQRWLAYVLDHVKTTPEEQLPNLLPQNFDKNLLSFV